MQTSSNGLICGVVEGFYGRPWNARQRHQLFGWLRSGRMNTYVYAPKADLKHRNRWREPYDEVECAELGALVRDCHQHGLRFVFGLSPGLDICFSSQPDFQALVDKLGQLIGLGCRDFALLFDDIPSDLPQSDVAAFGSLAEAHCDLANRVAQSLRAQLADPLILFCPTPYCGRMAILNPDYLPEVGRLLHSRIQVFWTGPEIVSGTIPSGSIEAVSAKIGRKPVLWDNLHANDYDLRRLNLGPYSGRPLDLRGAVSGILLNPNCQFESNFVPVHTFSDYLNAEAEYDPRAAFRRAVTGWLPEFASDGASPVTEQDLEFMGDVFYLPYGFGDRARDFLELFRELCREVPEPGKGAEALRRLAAECSALMGLFEKMCDIRNRDLLHALYPLLWELKEEAALIRACAAWLASDRAGGVGFQSQEHLPHTYRCGFVAELQRLLPMDSAGFFGDHTR